MANGWRLTLPNDTMLPQIASYRQALLDAHSSMDGTGALRRMDDPAEWLRWTQAVADPATVPEGLVQAVQYAAVRETDGLVLGMIQVRLRLNDYLALCGGHIGYSVRPSERRKGYAASMLRETLTRCPGLGLSRVLITCLTDNEASRRTILSQGGVYESTVEEPSTGNRLERYWIDLAWEDSHADS